MNTAAHYYHRGMGAGAPVTSSAGATVMAAGGVVALVNPLAGAIVALAGAVTELLGAIGVGKGCGQTCITASAYANQAEALLKQNISAYFAIAPPRPLSAQQAALSNFTQIWNGLVVACAGVPGAAGENCINDRKDGACKWKATAPSYPGEPNAGECWNWWNGYYYPIKNDPNVVADSVLSTAGSTMAGAVSSLFSGGISPILLLGVGLIGLAIVTQL